MFVGGIKGVEGHTVCRVGCTFWLSDGVMEGMVIFFWTRPGYIGWEVDETMLEYCRNTGTGVDIRLVAGEDLGNA